MNQNAAFGMLGLAAKAGKVVSGEFAVENEIRAGTVYLVIIASDASDNTAKKFCDKCKFYKVPVFTALDKVTLGHLIGKELRSVAAVKDKGFAGALIRKAQAADIEISNI